jgi:FtsH-binding integral membrane protein
MESFSIAPSDSLSILKYEENDRIGFIRKVYSIVSFQLLFTTVIVALTMASHSLEAALSDNPWLIGLAILGNCASAMTLMCFPMLSHKVPANYCLLGVFTICEALLVALICTQYEPSAVVLAGLMSCSVTLVLTVYACTTTITCLSSFYLPSSSKVTPCTDKKNRAPFFHEFRIKSPSSSYRITLLEM